MIGTAASTPYGTGMAERLGCDLANRGLVIFSGLARGVDYGFPPWRDFRKGQGCRGVWHGS
jgi:hypothetical protein